MTPGILKLLTWADIQEIWLETDNVLQDIQEHPEKYPGDVNVKSRFIEALRVLREKKKAAPPVQERYPVVLAAAEKAVGRVLSMGREKENTLIRCFVSYRLHNEGYSFPEIGRVMKRDHSTITHLAHRMRDILSVPCAYKDEIEMYNQFEGAL